MTKTSKEMVREVRERMRGGKGSVEITHVFTKDELRGHTRLFARLVLSPGSSIGYHAHENEEEVFSIIRGRALVNDNGVEKTVEAGDAVLTGGGAGHSIECIGQEPLELLAVILTW